MYFLCIVYIRWSNGEKGMGNKLIDDPFSDIIDEWLETFDEWEEENIDQEIQPYRKRSEDIKISDQDN